MSLIETLSQRAENKCELCSGEINLELFTVLPAANITEQTSLLICSTCQHQISLQSNDPQVNHWRCLTESMWSEFIPVKVMVFRILSSLKSEAWAQELLDQLYLEESHLEWAKAGLAEKVELGNEAPTLDSNGTRLMEGDSVTLIKDLDVKGAGFTAKRGTLVKNITLTSNTKHVEGRVNGIQIVLVAAFLKKA